MALPATVRTVNAALKARGDQVRLRRGQGYFYFYGGDTSLWFSSSIDSYTLDGWTVDQVLGEVDARRTR